MSRARCAGVFCRPLTREKWQRAERAGVGARAGAVGGEMWGMGTRVVRERDACWTMTATRLALCGAFWGSASRVRS
jgi:hypothetical protein